jgi:hypothetical protein
MDYRTDWDSKLVLQMVTESEQVTGAAKQLSLAAYRGNCSMMTNWLPVRNGFLDV